MRACPPPQESLGAKPIKSRKGLPLHNIVFINVENYLANETPTDQPISQEQNLAKSTSSTPKSPIVEKKETPKNINITENDEEKPADEKTKLTDSLEVELRDIELSFKNIENDL